MIINYDFPLLNRVAIAEGLFGLALGASLLAGFGMTGSRTRSWFHMLGFASAMAVSIYVILDLEYPRLGFIRVDVFDQVTLELRKSIIRALQAFERK